jgi:hypothetical protein
MPMINSAKKGQLPNYAEYQIYLREEIDIGPMSQHQAPLLSKSLYLYLL